MPEHVTILIKRALKQKRWRFQLTHRRVAEKFISDIRKRIGAEDGYNDDEEDESQKSVFSRASSVF